MLPKLTLSHSGMNSAYKIVERWLPSTRKRSRKETSLRPPIELGLCVPPGLRGGSPYADRVHRIYTVSDTLPKKREKTEEERRKTKEAARRIYDVVLEVLGSDKFKVSTKYIFKPEEEAEIIRVLRDEGYEIEEHDFINVIRVAEAVRDDEGKRRIPSLKDGEQYRHASLNCYDYLHLKEEMTHLDAEIGMSKIQLYCPTLYTIYMEALGNENAVYPGRHLPFGKIAGVKSSSAIRYQCLRLIDEILCTNKDDHFISHEEMNEKIRHLATKYGRQGYKDNKGGFVDFDKIDFSSSQLYHYYDILKQFISIEHSAGSATNYERDVFEAIRNVTKSKRFPNQGGRRYKKLPNGQRLSAFTVDISLEEGHRLRKEIGAIIAMFFDDDRGKFASMFPLISTLGYMEDILLNEDIYEDVIDEVSATDMRLIVYKFIKYAELKKNIRRAISMQLPIGIKKGNDWQIVYPIAIKEDSYKWALVARTEQSPRPILISAETLAQSYEMYSESFRIDPSDHKEARFIGLGEILLDEPQDVVLEVTPGGIKDLRSAKGKAVLQSLSPEIDNMNAGSWTIHSYEPAKRDTSKGGTVSFSHVYVNEDLLREIYQLDKAGKMLSVSPECVRRLYEEYFEAQAGQKWRHLEDRPTTNKRIRKNKNPLTE